MLHERMFLYSEWLYKVAQKTYACVRVESAVIIQAAFSNVTS
jgi:hypothetical protein